MINLFSQNEALILQKLRMTHEKVSLKAELEPEMSFSLKLQFKGITQAKPQVKKPNMKTILSLLAITLFFNFVSTRSLNMPEVNASKEVQHIRQKRHSNIFLPKFYFQEKALQNDRTSVVHRRDKRTKFVARQIVGAQVDQFLYVDPVGNKYRKVSYYEPM